VHQLADGPPVRAVGGVELLVVEPGDRVAETPGKRLDVGDPPLPPLRGDLSLQGELTDRVPKLVAHGIVREGVWRYPFPDNINTRRGAAQRRS
jgi:hypothetical protein